MLRMSKLSDYGTVVMAYIAQRPGRVLSTQEISTSVGLELPTVSKLLKSLVRTNLLLSQRGPKGGYRLARDPETISAADIIDSIEGYPMGLTECSSVPGLCSRESSCSVRTNWQRISLTIREILQRVTLADLARPLPPAIKLERFPQVDIAPRETETEVKYEHRNQATG
jgi:FeS assembly SUF system regulator